MPVTPGWPVELVHDGIGVYPHPGPTGFGILVTNPNGMSVIDWARSLMHLSIPDLKPAWPRAARARATSSRTPGSRRCLTCRRRGFGGSLEGVTLAATSVDIVRALLESIACELAISLDRCTGTASARA
jgi:sugar (pentulose or hexulose) kinase